MDELRFASRMSETEALVWALEDHDPALRPTIAVVVFLERSPGLDALQDHVERLTRLLPRFRDRVAPAGSSGLVPAWEQDPSFDLPFHVRHALLPTSGGASGVLRWAEPVVAEGLDRSRPLWQMTLLEDPRDERAALVLKLHHTFTDGLGAVKLAAALFAATPDSVEPGDLPPLPPVGSQHPLGRLAADVGHELRRSGVVARRALPVVGGLLAALRQPESEASTVMAQARSFARLVSPSVRPLSPVMTARSQRGHFELLEVPLDAARTVARTVNATVNDVFLAALLGGLRQYHERHGSRPDHIRVGVPISTRRTETEDMMSNQFAPVRLTMALQQADPRVRLLDVHRRMAAERAEPGLAGVEQLAAVVNRVPPLRPLLAATMGSVDVVASNVPGVDVPLYLLGARVTRMVPFGPRSGAALNVTMLSYDGTLYLGLNLDAAAIPDHDILLDSLRRGLAETIGA